MNKKEIDIESREDKNKNITSIKSKIDLTKTSEIINFGSEPQRKLQGFTESILSSVKAKDFNEMGDMLSDLAVAISSFDAETASKVFLPRLFSSTKRRVDKMVKSYSSAETNINSIVEGLEKHRLTLLQDLSMLEKLYDQSSTAVVELDEYILAGEEKIDEVKNHELADLESQANEANDPIVIQNYQHFNASVERFEKKLHDLKLTKAIITQMLPQIRLQQANNSLLIEKIHSSITNSIPLWKSQMVMSLGLVHTHTALRAQQTITDITNKMLVKNSEMLKTATIETAKEAEREIVDIETIKKANNDIITALKEVSAIQKAAKQKRADSEKELDKLYDDLKKSIVEVIETK